MSDLSKELKEASSIPIILSILKGGDTYGYEIIKRIKEVSDNQLEYKDGTLYPVLHKLEKKGFIESYWQKTGSGRKRKYYTISKVGQKKLAAEKEQWQFINRVIAKFWNIKPNLI